jgi:hypothetical protein
VSASNVSVRRKPSRVVIVADGAESFSDFSLKCCRSRNGAAISAPADDPPSSQFQDKSKRQGHRQADDEERKQEGDTGSLEKRHDPLQPSVSSGERGA